MVARITPTQSRAVNKLVRDSCCNCDHDNCLLLDDGDTHKCVQLISQTGINCNYFKNAVLPADENLYAEITHKSSGKICAECGKRFYSEAKNTRYCDACSEKIRRKKATERKRRQRAKSKMQKQCLLSQQALNLWIQIRSLGEFPLIPDKK